MMILLTVIGIIAFVLLIAGLALIVSAGRQSDEEEKNSHID